MRTVRAASAAASLVMLAALSPSPAAAGPAVSNDPLSSQQWALARIGMAAAWTRARGAGVLVGVVDSGVDLAHEDLASQVAASADCIGSNGDAGACRSGAGQGQDDNGHGTHVSGIVAAAKDNGKGVAGVAPGARLLVAKSLQSDGSGTSTDVEAGVRWVVDHGAKVVNLSLGENVFISQVLGSSIADAIEYAWAHGAIPVVTSGNTQALGLGSANYGSLHAVVVGATGPDDEVASYSSPTGDARWALVAPGGNGRDDRGRPSCAGSAAARCIVSTYWVSSQANAYANLEGTSMAAPHVSGALALLVGLGLGQQQAVDRLLQTVNRSVSCGANSANCHGRLDVDAATAGLAPASVAPATTAPPPSSPAGPPASTAPAAARVTSPPGVAPSDGSPPNSAPSPSVAGAPPPSVLGGQAFAGRNAAPEPGGAASGSHGDYPTLALMLASVCVAAAAGGAAIAVRRAATARRPTASG